MLYAWNRTGAPLPIPGTSVVLPASPSPPNRGPKLNITSEMEFMSLSVRQQVRALQNAGALELMWSDEPEFDTDPMIVLQAAAVTQGKEEALVGSYGNPTSSNPYATDRDPRLGNRRHPWPHVKSHLEGGDDPIPMATGTAAGLMSPADKRKVDTLQQGWLEALAGTGEPPSAENRFVTADHPGLLGPDPETLVSPGEKAALLGTSGIPGGENRYVTEDDPRMRNARPLPRADQRKLDSIIVANIPTTDQKAALAGTDGAPSGANPYVTDSDPRNSDSRSPTGAAGGDLTGTYPSPSLASLLGARTFFAEDDLTTSMLTALTIQHKKTSPGAAVNFGVAMIGEGSNAAGTITDIFSVRGRWTGAGAGAEASKIELCTRESGGALRAVINIMSGVGQLSAPAGSGVPLMLIGGQNDGASSIGVILAPPDGFSGTAQIVQFRSFFSSGAFARAAVDAAGRWRNLNTANEQTTVGSAGAASALPAFPTKYIQIVDQAGTTLVYPAYAAA